MLLIVVQLLERQLAYLKMAVVGSYLTTGCRAFLSLSIPLEICP